ncbi:MAG: TonB-dependent receptor [Kordiimonadaceae bacterium]|nr:TonB-dependent receptor [Kordiimonadaceae bacterium]MBO6568096.1 TonB-dependent receptor [Kordiimonadaceae bacterium]MBO6964174.1 TonB-dependent receptor [Kordiimonadaceae bacterium]
MKMNNNNFKHALLASVVLIAPAEVSARQSNTPPFVDVEEITVLGQFIPDEKRATSEIANVLDADAFALAGDGNVAAGLQRLPGVSVVGGGYVYVRGLGDRYSSSLLNYSGIPSPDPLRRVVPLDIFPTSIVESVLIQKTFSPEYPAEFGGGVIDIRTKAVPDEFLLEVGLSASYNSEATGKTGLSYDGTGSEIFGFGGSRRNLPEEILQDITLESLTPEELEAAGESLPNVWSIDEEPIYPGAGLNFVVGDRVEVGTDGAFGFFVAVDYDVDSRNRVGVRRTVTVNDSGAQAETNFAPEVCDNPEFGEVPPDDCGVRQTFLDVELNGMLSLGYEFNSDHTINYTGTVLRSSTKRSVIEKGLFAQEDALRTRSTIDWIESQVWTNQITGEHYVNLFGDSDTFQQTEINWRANISRSDRDVPARRSTIYELNPELGLDLILPTTVGNTTVYNALDEETKEFGLNFVQPAYIADLPIDFLGGFTYSEKARSFGLVRYTFQLARNAGLNDLRARVPEIIFGPENVGPGQNTLQELFDRSDFYTVDFENVQGYLGADVELSERARLALGVRYEDSSQIVNTAERITPFNPIRISQFGEFLLPSATLTYEIVENMQLRLAFSQTINRPDLRELSNARFVDEELNRTVQGNPELRIAEINNFDARFEWYFSTGESLTVGAFYKDFTRPIEQSAEAFGEGRLITAINATSAELKGVEVELDKVLFLQDWWGWDWLAGREIFLKVNGSYIDGETVTAEADRGIVTNLVRPFQGQSNWLANLQFGWRDYNRNENLAITLNYNSRRLRFIGVFGADDEYETPPLRLNLAYSKEFYVGDSILELSVDAENLLGDEFRLTQNGIVTEGYELGRTFTVGLSFKY